MKKILRVVSIMRAILLTGVLFVSGNAAYAQALPGKWSLQACFDYAQKNNIQLNTLRLSQAISREEWLLARSALYPNLSGGTSQTYTHSNGANPVVGGFSTQSSFTSLYSLSSAWTVYNAGYLRDNIRLQGLGLSSAILTTEQTANDLVLQITQNYLGILLARENIVSAEELLQTSKAQLKQGQDQYQAGSIARAALAELESQTDADQYNLVTARNAYRQNVLTLKQILQLPTGYSMEIALPDTVITTAPVAELEQAVSDAVATRPEIKNGELGIRQAQVSLQMAKAQQWPVASIGSSLATGYSNNEQTGYVEQTGNNLYEKIGLTISIPIFNNRTYKTQINVSRIKVDQASLALLGTKTTLSQQVEQAYISVLNSQAQYAAASAQLNSGRESYRVASEQFREGAANYVDLLQQKTLYVQAQQAYIQAKYSALFDLQLYNFYRGIPVKL